MLGLEEGHKNGKFFRILSCNVNSGSRVCELGNEQIQKHGQTHIVFLNIVMFSPDSGDTVLILWVLVVHKIM